MGLIRNLVSFVSRICRLACVVFISIWLYESFPLFSLFVDYIPVVASTLLLLGTLLYYGEENAHKIGEQKYHVNPMNINHSYRFGSCQARGHNNNYLSSDEDNIVESLSPSGSVADIYSILDELGPLSESDVPFPNVSTDQSHESTEYVNETDDDKESVVTWTGEDQRDAAGSERKQVLETLIARRRTLKNMRMLAEQNMVNMNPHLKNENNVSFNILRRYSYDPSGHKPDRVGPTSQPDSPRRHSFDPSRHRVGSTFQSNVPRRHERVDVGTDAPRRNSSDPSRHRVGPTIQSDVPRRPERFDAGPTFQSDVIPRRPERFDVGPTFQTYSPRRHSFDPSRHRVRPTFQSDVVPGRHERVDVGPTFQTDSPRRHSFDPSSHRVGATFKSNVPRVGPSTGVHDSWDLRKYRFLENNGNHQGDDKEVNISGGNRGYEKTSSGKIYFDASDVDEEDEYKSPDIPMAQGS